MLNVVLDTNVLVAALQSKNGASNTIVSLIEKQIFTIHLSVPLVMEYEDVLKRPKHRGTFTEEEIDEMLRDMDIDEQGMLSIDQALSVLFVGDYTE